MNASKRKTIMSVLGYLAVFAAIPVLVLYLYQDRLIYHPRPYPSNITAEGFGAVKIRYSTSQGEQTAYYLPPLSREEPRNVWFFFGGNGSLALDWIYFLKPFSEQDTAFVLFEYPGYGECRGKASPDSIAESMDAMVAQLRRERNMFPGAAIHVLGNSLGGAPALTFALRQDLTVSKIVLVAPFTTMKDMASLTVGSLVANLLKHRFDNVTNLKKILAGKAPPIAVFHGTADEVIPFHMGMKLAQLDSNRIRFYSYPGEKHNTVLGRAQSDIFDFMRGRTSAERSSADQPGEEEHPAPPVSETAQ